jgi:2,3-diaminopropionate biosynthesis protein SbnB
MSRNSIRILKASDVESLLFGREREVIQLVQSAYTVHAADESSLPHATFLRFPNNERNRIIALPAYLGQGFEAAGLKWIASFPGNHLLGLERASAVIVLNSTETGRPEAIIEGSIISARRTAASAALAAMYLHQSKPISVVGCIGCGVINFEIVRFLQVMFPEIETLVLHDIDAQRTRQYGDKYKRLSDGVNIRRVGDVSAVLGSAPLVAFATTATEPYINDISACPDGSTLLHISLRDLTPEVILTCDNIVDDIDHICQAKTSMHLAEQLMNSRSFIRGTLAQVICGALPARAGPGRVTVFSPFGLGVLDLALGKFVLDLASMTNRGIVIPDFLA